MMDEPILSPAEAVKRRRGSTTPVKPAASKEDKVTPDTVAPLESMAGYSTKIYRWREAALETKDSANVHPNVKMWSWFRWNDPDDASKIHTSALLIFDPEWLSALVGSTTIKSFVGHSVGDKVNKYVKENKR
jgi:hypothetical protein